jgi:hypothetical protein
VAAISKSFVILSILVSSVVANFLLAIRYHWEFLFFEFNKSAFYRLYSKNLSIMRLHRVSTVQSKYRPSFLIEKKTRVFKVFIKSQLSYLKTFICFYFHFLEFYIPGFNALQGPTRVFFA